MIRAVMLSIVWLCLSWTTSAHAGLVYYEETTSGPSTHITAKYDDPQEAKDGCNSKAGSAGTCVAELSYEPGTMKYRLPVLSCLDCTPPTVTTGIYAGCIQPRFQYRNGQCTKLPRTISVSGGSTTALPAGSPIPITATVIDEAGQTNIGISVSIISGGGGVSISAPGGSSNSATFKYVPPYFQATQALLQATCNDCDNVAYATVYVAACEVDQCASGAVGNPVQPGSAEKVEQTVDWQDRAPHPLSLQRVYRSQGNTPAAMGANWTHSFAGSLDISKDDVRMVMLGDGTRDMFTKDGALWKGPPGVSLTQQPTGWTYRQSRTDQTWEFNLQGLLTSSAERNGWTYTYQYNAEQLLSQVTNAFGRSLSFSYNPSGQLSSVLLPNGAHITYQYTNGMLTKATPPDGDYQQYVYEDARFPDALTGRLNAVGQRVGTYTYDDRARAVTTSMPGDVNKYQMSYGNGMPPTGTLVAMNFHDPTWSKGSMSVRHPNGTYESRTYEGANGKAVLTYSSRPLGQGIKTRTLVPDTNLVASQTDFNDVVTTTTWNTTRELPLTTVRASSRPEAQTTVFTWHPQWSLPTLVTTSGQNTSNTHQYTYDTKGNMLTHVWTSSLSTTPITTSATYQANSLMATETDAMGVVTQYTYDAAGNKATELRAGKTTQYTHDASGNILTMTDPAGVITTMTYTPGGKPLSVASGNLSTQWTYNAIGLPHTESLSSGYTKTYGYDALERLSGWTDNRGHTATVQWNSQNKPVEQVLSNQGGSQAWREVRNYQGPTPTFSGVSYGAHAMQWFGYDANEDLAWVQGPDSRTFTFTRDGIKRIVAEKSALNKSATLGYNGMNHVVQATDFKGVTTTFTRNTLGNALTETSPDMGALTTQYDSYGLPTLQTDVMGRTATIQRNTDGQITQMTRAHSGSSAQQLFQYDAHQELSSMQELHQESALQNDALRRRTTKNQSMEDTP